MFFNTKTANIYIGYASTSTTSSSAQRPLWPCMQRLRMRAVTISSVSDSVARRRRCSSEVEGRSSIRHGSLPCLTSTLSPALSGPEPHRQPLETGFGTKNTRSGNASSTYGTAFLSVARIYVYFESLLYIAKLGPDWDSLIALLRHSSRLCLFRKPFIYS